MPPLLFVFEQCWYWLLGAILLALSVQLLRQKVFCKLSEVAFLDVTEKAIDKNPSLFLLGLLVTVGGLAFLEIRQPLYFVQDDNFIQFLPVIRQGCESAFRGVLPLYNPYQLMGAPTATLGTYALTYPFTYEAYFIARTIGQPDAVLDVFAVIHLIAAYVVMHALLSKKGIRSSICSIAASSFSLSGFFLIAGRSWYYMLPVAVWAPLIVLCLDQILLRRTSIKWQLLLAFAIGMYFHSGNAQMWFYSLFFGLIAIASAWLTRTTTRTRLLSLIPPTVAGLGVAFPLLCLQFLETKDVWRHHDAGNISGISLLHILIPLGKWTANSQNQAFPQELNHFGFIFGAPLLVALVILIARLTVFNSDRNLIASVIGNNLWLPALLLSMFMACGTPGVAWDLLAWLPVFNKFTQSAKLVAFVTIFGIIIAATIIERLLSWISSDFSDSRNVCFSNRRIEVVLVSIGVLTLSIHLWNCDSSFYNFADAPSYAGLPAALLNRCAIKEGDITEGNRILAIAPDRSRTGGFTSSLNQNFPTRYNVVSLTGMDLLVSTNKSTLKVLEDCFKNSRAVTSAYGVKWLVVHRGMIHSSYGTVPWLWRYEQPDFFQQRMAQTLLPKSEKVIELNDISVYKTDDADPLVFAAVDRTKSLPAKISTQGISADVSGIQTGEAIVFAFMARPWITAHLDGKPITIGSDQFSRIVARLPIEGQVLTITYAPPLIPAVAGGFLLILVGTCIGVMLNRQQQGAKRVFTVSRESVDTIKR